MRNILKLLLLFPVLMLGVSACDDGERELDSITLEINYADYEFLSFGGEGIIQVQGTGNPIVPTSSDQWLTITGTSGNIINFTVDQFYEMSNRTAEVTITSGELSNKVNITQLGAVISVDTEYLFFNRVGSSLEISVRSDDLPYEVWNSESWLTLTGEETEENYTTFTFSTTTNSGRVNRLDTIVISFGREDYNGELRVPVSQLGTMQFNSYNNATFVMSSVDGNRDPKPDVVFTFKRDSGASVDRYIAESDDWDQDLIFNYSNGFLKLVGGTRVSEGFIRRIDDDDVLCFWTVYLRDIKNFNYGTSGALIGVPSYDSVTDTISFRFVDDGSAKVYVADGFFLSVLTDYGSPQRDNDGLEAAYIDVVLTLDE